MTANNSDFTNKKNHSRVPNSLWVWLLALALIALGIGIRLFDLTDPPLDFHPTRQLRGAIIARGIFYSLLTEAEPNTRQMAMNFAMSTGQYEPPILETLVAYTYLIAKGEIVWVARIYNSLFWVIGGLVLFDLTRKMTTLRGALLALTYYLLLPFGAQASRSFQPDPGMTMWVILSVYSIYRWSKSQHWKWAILAGCLGGMAILTKAVAVYLIVGASIATVLQTLGLKRFWKYAQVWIMALCMVTPPAAYYLLQNPGRISAYLSGWTTPLSYLVLQPQFYIRWLSFIQNLMGFSVLIIALVGVIVSAPPSRSILVGLWIGYFVYGLTLPYQMYTHNYYHIQLIPIVAISIAPFGEMILDRIFQQTKPWQIFAVGVFLVGIFYPSWVTIATLRGIDNRHAPEYWQKIGQLLPTDGKIIALTQDYGFPLMYYGWRKVSLWETSGEQELAELRGREKELESRLTNLMDGKDYFLVTSFNQFENQHNLKKYLFENFPLVAESKSYLLFDLAHPLTP